MKYFFTSSINFNGFQQISHRIVKVFIVSLKAFQNDKDKFKETYSFVLYHLRWYGQKPQKLISNTTKPEEYFPLQIPMVYYVNVDGRKKDTLQGFDSMQTKCIFSWPFPAQTLLLISFLSLFCPTMFNLR